VGRIEVREADDGGGVERVIFAVRGAEAREAFERAAAG
jgi:hypothetical protein